MSKCTKGKLRAEAFPGTENDPTWIIQDENNGIVFQTVGEYDEANAKEIVRRWDAFEEGGLVEELRKACEEAQKVFGFIAENYKSAPHFPAAERMVEAVLAKS